MKSEQSKGNTTTPRKKKAARACIHCQKAHLTCDDSRPCQRCIKRNLSSTCTDGTRKKAKYLQDIEDSEINNTSNSVNSPGSQSSLSTPFISSNNAFEPQNFLDTGIPSLATSNPTTSEHVGNLPVNQFNYGFGSTTTNLEYSILSNMLNSPMTESTSVMTASTSPVQTTIANDALRSIWSHQSPTADNNNNNNNTTYLSSPNAINQMLPNETNNNITSVSSSTMGASEISASGISTLSAYGDGAVVAKVASPVTASTGPSVRRKNQIVTPAMVYTSTVKPYSYAEGYHYLIDYVKSKMGREDLMRISRALALFRPSVLASMMNLTEDDLVFTEKCLQRTLLEYEKLISYSGTPTVVWRRTGEIAFVGKEFSLLTQWSRDALLSKKTYIYELMSNPSAVEYWEKYALHAFDNTDSAVYSTCILISPTKRVVPCTFCFTIKRDIFDLPSVIVGNFLPILS